MQNESLVSVVSTSVSPFFALGYALRNVHYIMMIYMEACLATVALVVNLTILIIFVRPEASNRIGPNVRLYYLGIAFFDLVSIIDGRFILSIISYGIKFATGGRVNANIGMYDDASCKLTYYLYNVSEQCSSFTFVLFSIERACALYFPLKSRTYFKYRRVRIMVATLYSVIFTCNIHSLIGGLYSATALANCVSATPQLYSLFYFTVGNIDYGLPFVLILVINLMTVIRVRSASRRRVMMASQKSQLESSSREKSALSTVLMLSASHCVIYLPSSIVQTWDAVNFAFLFSSLDIYYLMVINQIAWIAYHVTIFGKMISAVIYYLRVPYFRERVRAPLVSCGWAKSDA